MSDPLFNLEIDTPFDKFCEWLEYFHEKDSSRKELLYFKKSPRGNQQKNIYYYLSTPLSKIKPIWIDIIEGYKLEEIYTEDNTITKDEILLGTVTVQLSNTQGIEIIGIVSRADFQQQWEIFWRGLLSQYFPERVDTPMGLSPNPKRNKEKEELKDRIRDLANSGMTIDTIAYNVSVSPSTVKRYLDELGLTRHREKRK